MTGRRWLWPLAIGPAVLGLILLSIDRAALMTSLEQTRPGLLILGCVAVLPTVALRALRWKLLLGRLAARARIGEIVRIYAESIFVGSVTPARVGELVRVSRVPELAGDPDVGYGGGLASVLLDRLCDLALLVLLGVLGLVALFPAAAAASAAWLGAAAATLALLVGLGWLASSSRFADLRARAIGWLPGRAAARVSGLAREFGEAVRDVRAGTLALALALTLLAWVVGFYGNYLVSESLGLGMGYLEILGISAICSLVSLLPISILGAGTRDAALIVLLAPYGKSASEAVAFSVLLLGLTLWLSLACGLALVLPGRRRARQSGAKIV